MSERKELYRGPVPLDKGLDLPDGTRIAFMGDSIYRLYGVARPGRKARSYGHYLKIRTRAVAASKD